MRTGVIRVGRERFIVAHSKRWTRPEVILDGTTGLPAVLSSIQARRLAVALVKAAIEADVAEHQRRRRDRAGKSRAAAAEPRASEGEA